MLAQANITVDEDQDVALRVVRQYLTGIRLPQPASSRFGASDQSYALVIGGHALHDGRGVIAGAIIEHDDLKIGNRTLRHN